METIKTHSTSVIIPTYNGAKKILHLLRSLESQTFTDFETLIIVDGSTDNTVFLLNRCNFNLKKLTIVEQPNQDKSKTRNNGSKLAEGELLLFFDDDMILEPDCIQQHIHFHSDGKKKILTGNGYRRPLNTKNNFGKYIIHIEKYWQSLHPKEFQVALKEPVMTACNLSMKKELFVEMGGFDERLNDCEDIDFAIRALSNNIPVYYNSHVKAWHNDSPNLQLYINRLNQYTEGIKHLFNIHPEYQKLILPRFYKKNKSSLKKLILKIFRNKRFLTIDMYFEYKPIPTFITFFFYRLIISANSGSK